MKIGKSLAGALAAAFLILFLSGCDDDVEEPGISHIDWNNHDLRAEQIVNALINEDYSVIAEGFDNDMKSSLGVKGLRNGWRFVVNAAGEVGTIGETEIIPHDEYDIYHIVTVHSNRSVNTRIVFSHDGLIAGMFFSYLD